MGWFKEKKARFHRVDVVNSLMLQGVEMTPPGYPGANYLGRDYYVNNVSGSSANAGLDWGSAMGEVSTAITASEAHRAALATNNQNVRNRIFVQGTATPYTAITALPSYCDLIGIGAGPQGNGAGIVRIGADTGSGGGLTGTSSARGLYLANIQFQAGVSNYPFQMSNIFRSTIENCVFASNGSPGGAPAVGFEVAIGGGLTMRDCLWLNQSSAGNGCDTGFSVTGTHFHGCTIENCRIHGADQAVLIASTCVNGWDSRFRGCEFGFGSETCAIGVNDDATTGYIMYIGCFSQATTDYDLENDATGRVCGCLAANGYVVTS